MQVTKYFMVSQTATAEQAVKTSQETLSRAADVKQAKNEGRAFDRELIKAKANNNEKAVSENVTDNAAKDTQADKAAKEPVAVEKTETSGIPAEKLEGSAEEVQLPKLETEEKQEDLGLANDSAAMLMAMANSAMLIQQVQPEDVQQENVIMTQPEAKLAAPIEELQPVEPMATALEALLPQDDTANKQAIQNQQLMNMLQSNAAADARVAEKLNRPTAEVASNNNETEIVATEQAVTLQPSNVSVEQKNDKKSEDKRSSILEGIPLTVEDRTVENGAQAQMSGDMLQQQPKGDQKQVLKMSADGELIQQGAELPEEADFDVVKVTDKKETNTTHLTAGANSFVQSFSEAAAADKAGEVNNSMPLDFDIPKQIIEQAKLIRTNEDSQMVIRLKPDHLGELTLKISVTTGGTVNASFHSDNAQVRGIIESTMVQLKQELSEQGLKVDNIDVRTALDDSFLMDSQAGQQQGYYAQQQQGQAQTVRNQRADAMNYEADGDIMAAPAEAVSQSPQIANADGVDYLV